MNGNNLLLDTNTILYLLNGDETLSNLLDGNNLIVSFISEIELLGYHNLSKKEKSEIKRFLSECVIVDMSKEIKMLTIELRSLYRIKLGDSVIAATAICLNLPLITADKHFHKVKELNLVLYDLPKI